jgi:hypothetical protein
MEIDTFLFFWKLIFGAMSLGNMEVDGINCRNGWSFAMEYKESLCSPKIVTKSC